MRYNHLVNHNGKYYAAGEEVPDTTEKKSAEATVPENEPLPFEPKQYTKTEINRMSTAELQQLAAENGIENASETSGGELKKQLIELFGL